MEQRRTVLLGLGAGLAMALPAGLAAQCGEVEFGCKLDLTTYHTMLPPDTTETDKYMYGEHGMHEECIVCTDGEWGEVDAQNCHPWCGPDEDEEQELAFRTMIDEAGKLNVRAAVLAAVEVPGYGAVNPARRSLVIFEGLEEIVWVGPG
ncbi:MAG: hypothetical protein WEA24_17985 [Gemmatimonadota bacterium]